LALHKGKTLKITKSWRVAGGLKNDPPCLKSASRKEKLMRLAEWRIETLKKILKNSISFSFFVLIVL